MKTIKFLAMVLALALSMCIFTACGDGESAEVVVPEGSNSYTLEAEQTDLRDYMGTLYSGNRSAYDAVSDSNYGNVTETAAETISGGAFVSSFNTKGETITFVFTADKASTDNSLYISMGSEYGTLTISQDNISITANGTALDYDSFKVKGTYTDAMGGTYNTAFTTVQLPDFDIVEGENTIEIKVVDADYGLTDEAIQGQPHGPGIDCITIVTTSTLETIDYSELYA